jgi:hypothetical protein
MEETHKEYNLRASEDAMAVLLDCDMPAVDIDTLVDNLSKELKELRIENPPDQKQLKDQLQQISAVIPNLVDFVLISSDPLVPPVHGRVDWEGDYFNTGFIAGKDAGRVEGHKVVALKRYTGCRQCLWGLFPFVFSNCILV